MDDNIIDTYYMKFDRYIAEIEIYCDSNKHNNKLHNNIRDFVNDLYNHGIIFITKIDDSDFELYIQKSYIPKDSLIDEYSGTYNRTSIIRKRKGYTKENRKGPT